MSAQLIGAIPPQPHIDAKYPLHLYTCSTNGQRIAYGSANGVVVRCLPDQISFVYQPVETYVGTKRPVTCATIAPNNKAIVAGDNDGNCYVWMIGRSGTTFESYKLDRLQYVRLTDVAVSPDSRRIAIVGVDRYSKKLASIILLDGGMAVGQIAGHTKGIQGVQFRPKKPFTVMTVGMDGLLCLHDGPPFKLTSTYEAHDEAITAGRYSPCGDFIATCTVKGNLAIWNADTIENLACTTVEGTPVLFDVAWDASSSYVATASNDGLIRVFKRNDLEIIQSVQCGRGPDDMPKGLAWSMRYWIVVVCAGGHLKGWKLEEPKVAKPAALSDNAAELLELEEGLHDFVHSLSVQDTDDGGKEEAETPVTPVTPPPTSILPQLQPEADFTWFGPRGAPSAVDFDQSTGNLMVGTTLGFVMFLSTTQTVPSAFQVSRMDKDVTVKSCILSEQCAAAVTADGCLRIYSVRTTNIKTGDMKDRVRKNLENQTSATAVYTSATRQEFVLAATSQVEKVPLKLVFLDEGRYIALFCVDGTLCVFSVEKALEAGSGGIPKEDFTSEWTVVLLGKPTCVTATPDGSLLAVALWPCEEYPTSKFGDTSDSPPTEESEHLVDTSKPLIELYEIDSASDLDGFRFICVLDHHQTEITALSLNAEGSLLACVDLSRNVQVLEVETRQFAIMNEWNYHSTRVAALNWSPDGTKLVSASTNEIYVWDIENTYKSISVKDLHSGSVAFVKFLFNNIVLSAGSDGIMRTFELEYDNDESNE